ncbi:MAG: LTA synthase family protein [Chitinophagaceae bacterium]
MVGKIKFLVLYLLSWVLFFQLARGFFLLYQLKYTKSLSSETIFFSFLYGLRMDISMGSYILLPVCFFSLLGVFVSFFRRPIIYKIYTYVVLFLVLIIVSVDSELYSQWGFRIDTTPLKYTNSPKEVWATMSHLPVFLILIFFIVSYLFLAWTFAKIINTINRYQQRGSYKFISAFIIVIIMGLLIIPIRGGLQLAPINQSSVYFSTNNFANHAAINAFWNFFHGVTNKTSSTHNPYNYLPPVKAKQITDSLHSASGNFDKVLNTSTPNIIFIVWESFTEKATHLSIGKEEVTPYFNKLKKEGIYFSNAYASGDRTDKGITGILSGYPAINQRSIIRFPAKSGKLVVLSRLLKDKGYQTPFYYGGETEFANIKSYLLHGGFDPIIEKNAFPKKDQNSKWGAHDGIVASKMIKDIAKIKQPFFSTWLTLSSHEPFETPVPDFFKGDDHTTLLLNSLRYTDGVVNDFIEKCKQQSWWNNTLLIIVADHGHALPETGKKSDDFRIPILWLGGALSRTGETIDKVISQLDMPATITAQLGIKEKYFPFSKNIFDTATKEWAFYSFNNGFGFIQNKKTFVFDNVGGNVLEQQGSIAIDMECAKALQQIIYQDFLDK